MINLKKTSFLLIQITLLLCFFIASCNKKHDCIGKAKSDCVCPMYYQPVCGCDGKTYSNPCEANCNGIIEYTEGVCK